MLGNVYLFALVFGGGFFVISSLFGAHHSVRGDIGGIGHHLGAFFQHRGIQISHGHNQSGQEVNPLSLRNLLAFVAAFGLVGTIATYMQTSLILSLVLSIPAGIVAATLSWMMLLLMLSQQSTSQAMDSDFVGKEALVTVGIPVGNGVGEVNAVIKGQRLSIPARSAFGEPFNKGTRVVIIEYIKGGVVLVAGLD